MSDMNVIPTSVN